MLRSAKIILFSVILSTIPVCFSGCGLLKPSTKDKAMADERRNEKAAFNEMKAKEKAHYKAQPAETRKMMKKSLKESKKLNRSKKR